MPHTSPAPKKNSFRDKVEAAKAAKLRPVEIIETVAEYKELMLEKPCIDKRVVERERAVRVEYDVDGVVLPLRSGTLAARFLGHCRKDDEAGCWVWRGGFDSDGMPEMEAFGRMMKARRIGYELFGGNSARWHVFTMDCDNDSCVNPAHMRRYKVYERDEATRPYKHRSSKGRKLSLIALEDIRSSYLSKAQLAEKYGVTQWAIWAVQSGYRNSTRKGGLLTENQATKEKRDRIDMLMKAAKVLADLDATIIAEEYEKFETQLNDFTDFT